MSALRTDRLSEGQVVQIAVITRTVRGLHHHGDGTITVTWSPPRLQPLVDDPAATEAAYRESRLWITTAAPDHNPTPTTA